MIELAFDISKGDRVEFSVNPDSTMWVEAFSRDDTVLVRLSAEQARELMNFLVKNYA